MLRWYACALLVIRPAHFYYCFTLDYNYSDMLMYFVNFFILFVFVFENKNIYEQAKVWREQRKNDVVSGTVKLLL